MIFHNHPANPDFHETMRWGGKVAFDPMTAIFIGLSAVSAASQMSAAKKQAKATIAEGNIVAANKAQDIARKTATQRVSFLQSGLTLEGTPMNVIESTFNAGLTDLSQISDNYNRKAKSQISAGRSAAISSLASGFGSAGMPSMPDIGNPFSSTTAWGANAGVNDLSYGSGYS